MNTTYENRDGVATWKTGDHIIQIREDIGTVSEILHDWKNTKVDGVEAIKNWDESEDDVTIYVIRGNGGEHAIAVDIGTAIKISLKYVDDIRERLAN
jgi:hypothetical protein